jgi:DNA-binding GntR family transcriptional regulator
MSETNNNSKLNEAKELLTHYFQQQYSHSLSADCIRELEDICQLIHDSALENAIAHIQSHIQTELEKATAKPEPKPKRTRKTAKAA